MPLSGIVKREKGILTAENAKNAEIIRTIEI
jgi:hypothetical protein